MADGTCNIECVDMTYTRQQVIDLGYMSAEELANYCNNPRIVYFTIYTHEDGVRVLSPKVQGKDGSIKRDWYGEHLFPPETPNKEMFK